jgi:chorismate--pyruvate lyase
MDPIQMNAIWHDLSPQSIKLAPPLMRSWIALDSSMTAAVGRVAGGAIEVSVKRQEDGALHDDERMFFPAGGQATLREVCLSSQECPLLVARTSFTSDILRLHPQIVQLGTKPLGSLLFMGGVAARHSARQFREIKPDQPLYDLVRWRHKGPQTSYWGRRTLFWLFDAPLLVTEIMLPELVDSPNAHTALMKAAVGQ